MRLHEITGIGLCVLLINVSHACKWERVKLEIPNMTKLSERTLKSSLLEQHFSVSLSDFVFIVFTISDTVDTAPGEDVKK